MALTSQTGAVEGICERICDLETFLQPKAEWGEGLALARATFCSKPACVETNLARTVQMSPANETSRMIAQGWDVQILCHPPQGMAVLGLAEGRLKQKGSPSQMGSGRNPCPHLG